MANTSATLNSKARQPRALEEVLISKSFAAVHCMDSIFVIQKRNGHKETTD